MTAGGSKVEYRPRSGCRRRFWKPFAPVSVYREVFRPVVKPRKREKNLGTENGDAAVREQLKSAANECGKFPLVFAQSEGGP